MFTYYIRDVASGKVVNIGTTRKAFMEAVRINKRAMIPFQAFRVHQTSSTTWDRKDVWDNNKFITTAVFY